MKTITITNSAELDVPAAAAWAVVADYARDPQWRTGVQSMVPDPRGHAQEGTTTVEVLRLAGQTWHNNGVVVAVDPGRSFSWRTTEGADAHGSRTVEALSDQRCRVRLELNVTPHGIERLLAPLLRHMLRRNLGRDVQTLRGLLLAEPPLQEALPPRG